MEFFRGPLAVNLAERAGSKHVCFAADLFRPRPPFQEILPFADWGRELKVEMVKRMDRKACPVAWVAFFIDAEGAWMLASPKSEQTLCNMRQALSTVISTLPKEQRQSVEDTLRPLDELDADRLAAWKTVDDLRPKFRPPSAVGEADIVSAAFVKPRAPKPDVAPPPRAPTLAEWMEQHDSSDDEEEGASLPQTLMLYGSASVDADTALSTRGGPSHSAWVRWVAQAQAWATVTIATTGPTPELTYIRCHREERRRLLLTRRVTGEDSAPCMAETVRIAAKMARQGSLPGPDGPRGRKSEFLRRCAEAARTANPLAETDIKRLSPEDQAVIRLALGCGEAPYEGCLSEGCLDEETSWASRDLSMPRDSRKLTMSRCSRCGMPKAFGRVVSSLADIVRSMERGQKRDSEMSAEEARAPKRFRRQGRSAADVSDPEM